MDDVTHILHAIDSGESNESSKLLPLVYDELRRLAAARLSHETPGQTLNATALVHEVFVRLVDQTNPPGWNGRGHFFGAAAEAMRRILIDRARHKRSLKAGGNRARQEWVDVPSPVDDLAIDLIALNDALQKLEDSHPRKAELVKLRFFAGLTMEQAAEALGVSTSTADNDWAFARCWLKVEMDGGDETRAPRKPA